jgi:hypothetical protein
VAEVAEVEKRSSAGKPIAVRQSRWLDFAGIMTLVTGGLNAIDGLVGFYRTSYFRDAFVLGNLRFWSVALMALGAIQLAAGFAILGRQGWGRWFGLITVTVNAFIQLFVITSYPFWAGIIIAYDIAIFYALSVQWERRIVRN